MAEKEFEGSGLLIWFTDGKLKYRTAHDMKTMRDELERLKKLVPPRCIMMLAVNWDEKEILTFIGEKEKELAS